METVSECSHEFTLEMQTVRPFMPVFAFEMESVIALKEIAFEKKVVYNISYELSLEVGTVSEFLREFPSEIESVSAVNEIPFEKEIVRSIVYEFSSEKNCQRFRARCALEMGVNKGRKKSGRINLPSVQTDIGRAIRSQFTETPAKRR